MEKTSRARAEGGGMKKAREGEKVEFMSVSSCRASRPTELGSTPQWRSCDHV